MQLDVSLIGEGKHKESAGVHIKTMNGFGELGVESWELEVESFWG